MATRMQKYYENNENINSRTQKNQELYKEIANSELNQFKLSSNATILSDAKNNIDIDKIKKILDTRYNKLPQRKSIRLEQEEEKIEKIDDTKEYDINEKKKKAKEEKESSYEQERLKKLRDTQYDILNHLDLDKKEPESEVKESQDDLMELINTITAKELENKKNEEIDPLDILTDLKGEGEITSPIQKDEMALDSTLQTDDDVTDQLLAKVAEEQNKMQETTETDKSFFTTTSSFTESDFDDFNDLKAEVNSHKTIIIILVVIIMIVVVVALVVGLNHFLDLGLF